MIHDLAVTVEPFQFTSRQVGVAYEGSYVYDAYGQLSEMHTYRSDFGWNSDTLPAAAATSDVTIWHYQESTGLLTTKEDAARPAGHVHLYKRR